MSVSKNTTFSCPLGDQLEPGWTVRIEIEGGISAADMSIETIPGDFAIGIPEKPSTDYRYAVFYKQEDGYVAPLISKDGKELTLALEYVIDGERVNPGVLAYAIETGKTITNEEYTDICRERAMAQFSGSTPMADDILQAAKEASIKKGTHV